MVILRKEPEFKSIEATTVEEIHICLGSRFQLTADALGINRSTVKSIINNRRSNVVIKSGDKYVVTWGK